MWRQQKDFSSEVRAIEANISLLCAVNGARTCAQGLAVSDSRTTRRCGYTALRQMSLLLCDEQLPENHEEVLLGHLAKLSETLCASKSRPLHQQVAAKCRESYLTDQMTSSSRSHTSNRRRRGSSVIMTTTSVLGDGDENEAVDEDAVRSNPWTRVVDEHFLWAHEEGLGANSPGRIRRMSGVAIGSPRSAEASRLLRARSASASDVESTSRLFLKPSSIATPALAGETAVASNEALFLEEAELAASALSILDVHPLSSTRNNLQSSALAHHTQSSIGRVGSSLLPFTKLLRRAVVPLADSDDNLSATTPRSSSELVTADAPPSRAADASSSVTSTEFNSQLKEHFVRMLLVPQLLPHPARKCVERFVAMCESTVLRLGGATTALRSRGEDELLFACPFGAVRVRDVVEVFLLDRVFFISALCDKWIQCMFRDRGIPHTVELGAPGDTTSSTSTGLTGSSRLAPGSGSSSDFGEPRSLTWQSRQVAGGVTWGRDVPKVDISDPVRIFLPELIDSQIDAHALRLLLEEGEGPVAPERSAEAPPSVLSDQLLLRGLSEKLAEQLLGLIARLPAMPFVAAFYESLMDLLVSAYNVVEFAALEECGTAVGADSVFPLLVNVLSSIPRATQRLWRLLKWMDNSTVARQLPIFKSKGLSSYVLLSFTAAVEVAISEKTTV